MFEELKQETDADAMMYASSTDRFNNMMTEKDPFHAEMERQIAETTISYDSVDLSEYERKKMRCYGEQDPSESYIIEPRQPLKDIQQQTRRVQSLVIEEWKQR
eukprot:4922126-Prymnesium_polylepis.1